MQLLEIESVSHTQFNIDKNTIAGKENDTPQNNAINPDDDLQVIYFARPSVRTNEQGFLELIPNIKRITDAFKNTANIFNDVFGMENTRIYPSLKPIRTIKQKYVDNMGTEIASALEQKALIMQQVPYKLDVSLVDQYVYLYENDKEFFA
jgi:hypothetical protein